SPWSFVSGPAPAWSCWSTGRGTTSHTIAGCVPSSVVTAAPTSHSRLPEQTSPLRGVDLNHRPRGYEPRELPDCSTPRRGCYRAPDPLSSNAGPSRRECATADTGRAHPVPRAPAALTQMRAERPKFVRERARLAHGRAWERGLLCGGTLSAGRRNAHATQIIPHARRARGLSGRSAALDRLGGLWLRQARSTPRQHPPVRGGTHADGHPLQRRAHG